MRSGSRLQMLLAVLVFTVLVIAGETVEAQQSSADAGTAATEPTEARESTDETFSVRPFVTFQSQGSFRFRADMFGNADLDLPVVGTRVGSSIAWGSGFLPGLSEGALPGEDPADLIAGANIRLRWEPSVTIGENVRVMTQIDFLDNLVLGSTPDYAPGRPDSPLPFFAQSQASPTGGINSVTDAFRVKRAWAEWELFHMVLFQVGRMPHDWGMGMLHNGGDCDDCDYGDSVDRVGVRLDLPVGFFFKFGWDFPGEGALIADPRDFFGQPYDASQLDDVDQYVFEIYDRPETLEQRRARAVDLNERRVAVVDWGIYNALRFEDYSSLVEDVSADCQPEEKPVLTGSGLDEDAAAQSSSFGYDCVQLTRRGAFFWIPDAWIRIEWRPSLVQRLLVEVELAGVLVSDVAQVEANPSVDSSKELWGGAGVVRASFQQESTTYGLEIGAATGDDVGVFGVRDRSNVVVGDANLRDPAYAAIRSNSSVTNFLFNRDYHVDLLLFREVIGAVTNTVYTKPWVRHDIVAAGDWTLGVQLDALYAAAMMPDGTPGRDSQLGFEGDLRVFLNIDRYFSGIVEGGVLVPFGGLDDAVTGTAASPAWTLQGRLHLRF